MSEVFYVLSSFVYQLLSVLSLLILIRAILSWLPLDEDGPVVSFVNMVTEPIVMPVRTLLERIELFQNMPFDFSSFFAIVFLALLQTLLEVFG